MKIAVAFNSRDGKLYARRGVRSHEWINPQRVQEIARTLGRMGHEVRVIDADLQVISQLQDFFDPLAPEDEWPGLVFNLAYGLQGELRYAHLPAILEMMGLPYLGSDPLGHALAYDKLTAKRLFRAAELPSPKGTPLGATPTANEEQPLPAIIKPVADAASEGLAIAHDAGDFPNAAREVREAVGGPALAEELVDGRELNVSLIGNGEELQPLPVAEVVISGSGPKIYDADTKKGKGDRRSELVCPAELDRETAEQAQQLAMHAFQVLRCRDWARADFRLDHEGNLTLLEMNTIPGIAPQSSFPTACRAAGIEDQPALLRRLIDTAMRRYGHRSEPGGAERPTTHGKAAWADPTPPTRSGGRSEDVRGATFGGQRPSRDDLRDGDSPLDE